MGFIEETGAAQYLRDARIAPIYEGTNGIQAIDLVFRKLPMRGGEAVKSLLAEIRGLAAALAGENEPALAALGGGLTDAVDALEAATEWLADKVHTAPDDAAAGCSPYLRMFGLTVGGYLLTRGARAAARLLAEDGADRAFLAAKLATARFYAEQILPQAPALLGPVTRGAETLFAIDADQLCA